MPDEDRILGRVGHDLRGELATIVAGVHYLLRYEAGLSESGRQMLERVNGAGGRLRKLLDELELSPWAGGSGRPTNLVLEPCRLGALVDGALGRIERAIAQRKVTVHSDLARDLPPFEGDPELLGAALEYALDFAVARSPNKSIEVCAKGPASVVVIDEGGSVDASILAHILEPFVEKDVVPRPEPGARRRDRLGLGLAIARGICVAHGGDIDASIAPDGRGIALACRLTRALAQDAGG
jgi:K+-sensing histidine kinase KdpD